MGQTGVQLSIFAKEHESAADDWINTLLALHCLMTGHAFDWDRSSVIGKETPRPTRDFIEASNTTDPGLQSSTRLLAATKSSASSNQ